MIQLPTSQTGKSAMEVAQEAIHHAGSELNKKFGMPRNIAHKGKANIVTDADFAAEKIIISLLTKEFPAFNILTEESNYHEGTSPYTWIVDPLDGTSNYTNGIPFYSVNIALAHDRDIILGLTYDPWRNEIFQAVSGYGAQLNGGTIRVSTKNDLENCLLGFDLGYADENARDTMGIISELWPKVRAIRIMGSSALGLAYVAAGRIDIYLHHRLSPWDIASGILLAKEAGGIVCGRNGEPITYLDPSIVSTSYPILRLFLEASQGLKWRQV